MPSKSSRFVFDSRCLATASTAYIPQQRCSTVPVLRPLATPWQIPIRVRVTLKSKLCYDRRSVYQFGLVANPPIWSPRPDFSYCQTVAGLLVWGALSDERADLSFTIAAGPRQRSHSRVRVLRDSSPYFTVSDSPLPQPGGPGPRIYILQEQDGPVILPGTGFPFRPLLRLAGIQLTYSKGGVRVTLRLVVYRQSVRLGSKPLEIHG
jgi:hypothetical protein